MTSAQELTLIICAVCAAVTVGAHVLFKHPVTASLVALAMCVGGVVFWAWLHRAETALWTIGALVASGIAMGAAMAVSLVCTFVKLVRAAGRQSSSETGRS